jgi:hypothetical protein
MANIGRRLISPIVLLVAFLVAAGLVGQPIVAGAATQHRAAVIVDTGASVHRVVITFTEDSITGIDALQRAKADPVVYTFNGQGGAVCRIFGVGRDAGPGCLGGQNGDSRYWAYFRAPAGTSSFKYSTVGAGQAKVHDGDVEGWKFGTGAAPVFVSLQSLTPPRGPDPTNPPVPAPVTEASGAGGSNRSSGPARGNQAIADAATSASTLPATGATGPAAAATGPAAASENGSATTSRERGGDEKRTAKKQDATQAALASSSKGDSSSAASLIWFGVLIALIVIAIVVARRLRRRAVP